MLCISGKHVFKEYYKNPELTTQAKFMYKGKEYLNEKNVSLYNNKNIKIPNEISSYSLKYNNFAYKLSPYYRQGSFYVNVTIYITDINNVKTYYDSNIKENIYLIPLKLNIKL